MEITAENPNGSSKQTPGIGYLIAEKLIAGFAIHHVEEASFSSKIAKANGGQLDAPSTPAKTCFTLTMPDA